MAFEAEAGLFHMLALLRANDSALHPELRGLIDAATMEVTPYYLAHRGVEALLELMQGRYDKASQMAAQLLEQPCRCEAAAAIVALAALFIDADLIRERSAHHEGEYNRLAQTMPVLARIHAGILSQDLPAMAHPGASVPRSLGARTSSRLRRLFRSSSPGSTPSIR